MRNIITLLCAALLAVSCGKRSQMTGAWSENGDDTICTTPQCTILLQPYDDFTQKEAASLKADLKEHLDQMLYGVWSLEVLPTKQMRKEWYYKPRNRYRADKIIGYLESQVGKEARDTVIIGLTHHDISTSIHGQKDYGIMGLSHMPGHACVVSTYRLTKRSQLWKVTTHEFIHAFLGYPHCPKNDPHCIMQDAHGKNTFDMKNDLCDYCKGRI